MLTMAAVTALAELIARAGIGVWSSSAGYGPSDTGIVIGRLPLKPVKAIGLTPYRVVGAVPDAEAGISGVQVRIRTGTLTDLVNTQNAITELLDYRGPTVLGGSHFAQIWCAISTPPNALGSTDLPELADTYYLRTDR